MNHLIFPFPAYPLQGDIESQAGSNYTKVVGLQRVPLLASDLIGGEKVTYDVNLAAWKPFRRTTVMVNNLPISDDWIISVNVNPVVQVNGA